MKRLRSEYLLAGVMICSAIPFLTLLGRADYTLLQTNPSAFWPLFFGTLANVFGFLGALLFFWQLVIGTRHFTKYLSSNTIWINKMHRLLGTYGILFVLGHPLLEVYSYGKSLPWLFQFSTETASEFYISFGRVALLLFLTIWITSAIIRGKIKFRPWKYLHYLAYPLMGFVFYHALSLGTYLSTVPAIRVLWLFLIAASILLFLLRIAIGGGLFKKNYRIASIEHIGDSIILLRLHPQAHPIRIPEIGQYAYLQQKRFHEAHPFTIMDIDPETHELTFGIRVLGPFTRALPHLQIGSSLLVDGPYGTFTREAHHPNPKVVIAGGIGVTPFIRLAKTYGNGMTFIYCNRKETDIVKRDIIRTATEEYIDILEQIPNESNSPHVIQGRLDLPLLTKLIDPPRLSTLPFFVCGSPSFIKAVKQLLKLAGVPKKHIYAEELGFL